MEFTYQYINFYSSIKKYKIPIIERYDYYRVFNVSLTKIGNKYLYSARIRLQSKIDQNDEFIPGNLPKCNIDVGNNFWWGRWLAGRDITLFFIGDHNTNDNFELLRLKHSIPHNFYPHDLIEEYYILDGDIRLCNIEGNVYIQATNLKYILKVVDIKNNEMILGFPIYVRTRGKNQQIMTIDNSIVKFVDWYTKYGVGIGESEYDDSTKYKFINYKNFVILGDGSYDNKDSDMMELLNTNYGIMPKFSFSTPHIKINNNTLLGVGHIKIYTSEDFKYVQDSNIEIFRKKLNLYMKSKFGNKYIRHLGTGNCEGYIYMLYFYIIDIDAPEKNHMRISNGYLPVYLGEKTPDGIYDRNYKFSLIFPTGLEKINNDNIVVTCGEGDFYAIALTFNIYEVIDSCVHDIKNLDLRKYEYILLEAF